MVGFLSFAVCYKHGPLVDERNVNLLTWTLRFLALLLIYCGVTVPQYSYALMILILSSRSLRYPLKAFSYMRWCVSFLPCKLDILISDFIYCFGKFLARVIFCLIINYISSGDLREEEERERKHRIPSPFLVFVNLSEDFPQLLGNYRSPRIH